MFQKKMIVLLFLPNKLRFTFKKNKIETLSSKQTISKPGKFIPIEKYKLNIEKNRMGKSIKIMAGNRNTKNVYITVS